MTRPDARFKPGMDARDEHATPAHIGMPTTDWGKIKHLAGDDPRAAAAALTAILTRYTPALRSYLMRRWRFSRDVAEDLVQEFLTAKFLQTNLGRRADPARGKFRTLVLTALQNFVISQARRKRIICVDEAAAEQSPAEGATPDAQAVVEWARDLLREAIRCMEAECQASQRHGTWTVFEERLLRPVLDGVPATEYRELTARLGFANDEATQNALVTGKRMFQRHLRALVAEYAGSEAEIDEEIRELLATFSRLTAPARAGKGPADEAADG